MFNIRYKNNSYQCDKDESVLQTFLRYGVAIPFSCKNGVCQTCLMRAVVGNVSELAAKGLKQNLVNKNYFKACSCVPSEDMEVADPIPTDILITALVKKKELVAPDVCRFLLEPYKDFTYHSGQFINLYRSESDSRSYSLSSVLHEDYFLEIYVKKVAGGVFSQWLFDELSEGDDIELQGANGDCFYNLDDYSSVANKHYDNSSPLLLIGTGTGISPLFGIAREALLSSHKGDIYLYHGSHSPQGLFLHKKLTQLQEQYSQFHYIACVSGESQEQSAALHFEQGRANSVALAAHTDLTGWTVFLCGQPEMVNSTQVKAIQLGVEAEHIKADPFWPTENFQKKDRRYYPKPDPEMWEALGQGKLLRKILDDFYDRVYEDPRLSGFFTGTTKRRSIEKQYSFSYQVFTGENVYFGDRPRNAHHWMVISNDLFDYRQSIMADCLRLHGLAEEFVKRWFIMEDEYRAEIVKDKPWNLIKFGKEIPLEGFEELVMDSATLCDNCQAEVNVGDVVRYHVRLGKIYCRKCRQD